MRDNNLIDTKKKNFWEDRAVMVVTITVTVFLGFFTLFEFLTLKLEQSSEKVVETTEDIIENTTVVDVIGGGMLLGENKTDFAGSDQMQQGTTEGESEIKVPADVESAEIIENTEEVMEEKEAETEEPFPYYLKINRQQNVVTVYEKDEAGEYTVPVKAILCSTGLHNATPKGTFKLSSKYIWRELYGGVYGQYASRITGGVLFHSVPYASKNKATLSVTKYNKLGQQASMGCVRLTVADAKWIYDNCPSGTYVEIYDSEDPGPLGKPEALKLDADSPNKGWDPTDPDERNPWHAWSKDE